jgi:TM2 domain-containing membrane protein YozV
MKTCPKCSLESAEDQRFCPACGTSLQSNLEKFLESQGISQLAGAMKAHDITSLEVLKELEENDLGELGLAYGDKVRIKVAIESLRKSETVQETTPVLVSSVSYQSEGRVSPSPVSSQPNISFSIVGSSVPPVPPAESGAVAPPVLPPPIAPSVQTVANQNPQKQGSAGNVVAALCSFWIPGLGQLIQGRVGSAIGFFIGSVLLWIVLLGWIVHIWACLNAARWKPKN